MRALERLEGDEALINGPQEIVEDLIFRQTSKSYHRYEGYGKLRTVYLRKEVVDSKGAPPKMIFLVSIESHQGMQKLKLVRKTEHSCIYYGDSSSPIGIAYIKSPLSWSLDQPIFIEMIE